MQRFRRHQVFVHNAVKEVVYTYGLPAAFFEKIPEFYRDFGVVSGGVWDFDFAAQEPTEAIPIEKGKNQPR